MSDQPFFAELVCASNYSFLRGASHPADMVKQALQLGLSGLGIADQNSVAGVVRAWAFLRDMRRELGDAMPPFTLVVGARLVFADGTPDIVAYPLNRHGWGRLTRLLSTGNLRAEKGGCILNFSDLAEYAQDMALIAMGGDLEFLQRLRALSPKQTWLAAAMNRSGRDERHLMRQMALAEAAGIPLIATSDALYATAEQRPLHDIISCIHQGLTLEKAGRRLLPNAERHLKSPTEMARLFRLCPAAMKESRRLIRRINFRLDQLQYEYPHESVPDGWNPLSYLYHLVKKAALERYGAPLQPKVRSLIAEEMRLIRKQKYAHYFLTVYDLVRFARAQNPPVLCQGRGSAANSIVCFLLGVTSVDPMQHALLFTRFISEERNEPPDIDVDFEHERREEVIQYIYARYGRHRAAIAATVIHYRPRSTVREVGKVLGFSEDVTARLADTSWGSKGSDVPEERLNEAGLDLTHPDVARFYRFVGELLSFPRHLSQHVGGFILTEGRLDEIVPIHNGAMEGRSFIEWDKDDIDALGLMKVDVLALGMLTCIRKCFALMEQHGLGKKTLEVDLSADDSAVYAMLQKGDSIGVFQVESRAQINMLPRLKPREFYDLVVQVAIVRPGPIEGDMVHPYLRRRSGREPVIYPSPAPPHPKDELYQVLGKTFGVPLFQEQAMKLAIVAAGFTPNEANGLRRAMATFRNVGTINNFRDKLVGGMTARGYEADFAERCFRQIEGFGSYGFPESHAQSFGRLVYVSAWLKCHHPAIFTCGLLNSQPMGFYAPAQLVRDAREHGVEVRPLDVNHSDWDNSLERRDDGALALRLGLRMITGFRESWAEDLKMARRSRHFSSVEELARRAHLPSRALNLLAEGDAFGSMGLDRRPALWDARRVKQGVLPLFEAAGVDALGAEESSALPIMPASEQVITDYQTTRLSLRGHPMSFLRDKLSAEGVLSCDATNKARNGHIVRTAGVALIRQRPGKGNAIFITLEDESGVTNLLLWARDFERYRRVVMTSRLILAEGEVQRSPEGVVHLMAKRIEDRTAMLDQLVTQQAASPDEDGSDFAILRTQEGSQGHHPRNVRILPKSRELPQSRNMPKSRDFH
jgi:error-prone DNA polymerase